MVPNKRSPHIMILGLSALLLLAIYPASAYIITLDSPDEVAAGIPLVVTGSTTFSPGTPIAVVLSPAQAAGSESARKETVVDEQKKFGATFDTTSLAPGQYKVELRPDRSMLAKIGSGSVMYHLVTVTGNAPDIEISSPRSVIAGEDLVVRGTIRNLNREGMQIRVIGPSGILFGTRYVPLDKDEEKKTASFFLRVEADLPGNYYVEFFDGERPLGSLLFTAEGAESRITPSTTPQGTATPTPGIPVTTRAALPPVSLVTGLICLFIVIGRIRHT